MKVIIYLIITIMIIGIATAGITMSKDSVLDYLSVTIGEDIDTGVADIITTEAAAKDKTVEEIAVYKYVSEKEENYMNSITDQVKDIAYTTCEDNLTIAKLCLITLGDALKIDYTI